MKQVINTITSEIESKKSELGLLCMILEDMGVGQPDEEHYIQKRISTLKLEIDRLQRLLQNVRG